LAFFPRRYAAHSGHVHTADVPGGNEISPTREPMEGPAEAVALCDV
jgi:hypothetical protein